MTMSLPSELKPALRQFWKQALSPPFTPLGGVPFLHGMNDALSVAPEKWAGLFNTRPQQALLLKPLPLATQVTEHLVVLLVSNGRTTQQSSPLSSSFWPRLDAPDSDGEVAS